ncbi:MAG: YrzI family small protein [Neobacillus sp.]
MTLNIFFLTITINKRKLSIQEIQHQEQVEKLYEANKDRQMSIHRFM